ncbi:MAG: tRNA guanosine transglycosylase [Candidatus Tectimicrobiota bacterium]
MPPALEWFANLTNANTRRAYRQDIHDFMASIGNSNGLFPRPRHRDPPDCRPRRWGCLLGWGAGNTFMGWPSPILTDSGGFQVFSLGNLARVSEAGVTFQSHIDGSRHTITSERAIDIQMALGSDIMMVRDECTAYPATYDSARLSMEMTCRWARRCLEAAQQHPGGLFGIVQGSTYPQLREICAQTLMESNFDGYTLGGFAVGEPRDVMYDLVERTALHLPHDKPRYLLGVGKPQDLLQAVRAGIDMFDCVMPTRNAGSLDILEKRLAPPQHTTKQHIRRIAPLEYRVEQESQQVEAEQKRCEILLAMAEVLFQMIPLGLEDVIVVVVDLPTLCPACATSTSLSAVRG